MIQPEFKARAPHATRNVFKEVGIAPMDLRPHAQAVPIKFTRCGARQDECCSQFVASNDEGAPCGSVPHSSADKKAPPIRTRSLCFTRGVDRHRHGEPPVSLLGQPQQQRHPASAHALMRAVRCAVGQHAKERFSFCSAKVAVLPSTCVFSAQASVCSPGHVCLERWRCFWSFCGVHAGGGCAVCACLFTAV